MSSPIATGLPESGGTRIKEQAIAGERVSIGTRLGNYALIHVQLALILVVVYQFDVAARNHFFPILCAAFGGFALRIWLPARFRLAFFGLLSLGLILFVMGWQNGFWVIAIGSGLIGLCRLPVRFSLRLGLVSIAGIALMTSRLDFDGPFWPVLGSMFMFRLVIYLFELRERSARPSLPLTLAYFFPLQNICFLFFPILDFKTFRESYRAEGGWQAPQAGIVWIVRGLGHLLAYRIVKYYVLPAPNELGDLPHVALLLAANYALYMQVSGYFHIITGIFHLFGFELPRTHHLYFLASSFTDIWRRINIYWKDFMMKFFFLPTFFAMRGRGQGFAVAVAGACVFLATWLLHAYQVFWITGGLHIHLYDAALWLLVGVIVISNLQFDLRRARVPRTHENRSTILGAFGYAARVVAMFVLVSFFWACWNTPAVIPVIRALKWSDTRTLFDAGYLAAILAGVIGFGACAQLVWSTLPRLRRLSRVASPRAAALVSTAALAAFAAISAPGGSEFFGPRFSSSVLALRRESATALEAALAVQGYYENIANVRVQPGSWLAGIEGRPVPVQPNFYTEMSRLSDDLLERELIPDWRGEVDGAEISINRFGMRDRPERELAKPPGTCRIALVGSSVVMGLGVGDRDTFAYLLEEDLNARQRPGSVRYEFLNFGTGKSYALQRRVLIDRKVLQFQPDAIYVFVHQDELAFGPAQHMAKLLARKTPLPYPNLYEVAREAGITPETSEGMANALLLPLTRKMVLGIYRDLATECHRRGILVVWINLPIPGVAEAPAGSEDLTELGREAGFVVANLAGWSAGHHPAEVKLSATDHHANALGHRLIAQHLEALLRRRPDLLPAFARIQP